MRCSQLRALPAEMVSDDGHGGSTGAAGASGRGGATGAAADDNQQKNVMQSQFTMFWNDKNVAGITIWGYIVGSTWVTNSGLMTSSGTMRPAMTWLMGFLGR